jgi:hypothetical protein
VASLNKIECNTVLLMLVFTSIPVGSLEVSHSDIK